MPQAKGADARADLKRIAVELIYALPDEQCLLTCELPSGACIRDAVLASKVLEYYPELVLDALEVGIFSNRMTLDTLLKAGDRVEIYRPLLADPKEVRKRRAANKQSGKKTEPI